MSEVPTVAGGPRRTMREQRGHLWIAKLRRLPCFDQIVKKLIDGQGVATVARWCRELNPEGEVHNKTLETWRKYLTPLAMRIRNDLKTVKHVEVEPLAYHAAMEELKRQQEAMAAVLRKIGAEVLKYEIGEQRLKGKSMPPAGPYPGGVLPHPALEQLDPLAREAAKFDAVDRNLMREIATKMIDMYEEEKASRQTEVGGLAPDAGGKLVAQAEVSESGVGSDV